MGRNFSNMTTRVREKVSAFYNSLLDLIYPRLCVCCENPLEDGVESLCFDCLCQLPLTNLAEIKGNEIERKLWVKDVIGPFDTEYATAYLYFEKGNSTSKILHSIKYHGNKKLAVQMGSYFGETLKGGRWEDIDLLIPVPLHPKRFRQRGYNQSEKICEGLSKALGKPVVTDVIIRKVANSTQTKKSAVERWSNVENIFASQNLEKIEGKHIAIVDDVLTTGATIHACMNALEGAKNIKISILALASTI